MGVQCYLELGSSYRSLNYVKAAGIDKVIGVDLNGRPSELRDDILYISGNTHDESTYREVLTHLNMKPDAIFIDADHSEESVSKDFTMWWPHANILVGFHDVLMPSVAPFWRAISRTIPSVDICGRDLASARAWQNDVPADGNLQCGGIGVLFK
jgi:hypothetical protein